MDEKKINLDEFGEVIEKFITENDVCLVARSKTGTQDFTIETNTNLGPVVEFFMLIKCIPDVFMHFREILDEKLTENFIDEVLKTRSWIG